MLQRMTETQVRLMALADRLESMPEERLDLSVWARREPLLDDGSYFQSPEELARLIRLRPESECKTVVCLAGLTVIMYRDEVTRAEHRVWDEGLDVTFMEVAAVLLSLDGATAEALFAPTFGLSYLWDMDEIHRSRAKITRARAVRVVHHLALTGEVDWSL